MIYFNQISVQHSDFALINCQMINKSCTPLGFKHLSYNAVIYNAIYFNLSISFIINFGFLNHVFYQSKNLNLLYHAIVTFLAFENLNFLLLTEIIFIIFHKIDEIKKNYNLSL